LQLETPPHDLTVPFFWTGVCGGCEAGSTWVVHQRAWKPQGLFQAPRALLHSFVPHSDSMTSTEREVLRSLHDSQCVGCPRWASMMKSPDELSVLFGADSGHGGEMPVHRTHYGVCRCHYLYRHPRVSYVYVCVRVCVCIRGRSWWQELHYARTRSHLEILPRFSRKCFFTCLGLLRK